MEGTIIKIISNLLYVDTGDKVYDCRPRGKFYHENLTPLVGDHVIIDEKNKYILEIKERKNYLLRPNIANTDIALIITSVKEPNLSFNLLDKLLCVSLNKKIEPIIIFTKTDLLSFKEKQDLKKVIKYYNKIGIKAITNKNILTFNKLIKGKICFLTGQTGAGKSTFLNKINPRLNLETNEISKALNRGKHTTRVVELFKYHHSLIADTPGFSSIDLSEMSKEELRDTFIEFHHDCEYKDCFHLNEKNCKVKERVLKKEIMQSRYDNYLKFMGEL
jgi:ribosome biogenesis GTPase / thiamine phosphate phosphatase